MDCFFESIYYLKEISTDKKEGGYNMKRLLIALIGFVGGFAIFRGIKSIKEDIDAYIDDVSQIPD